MVIMETIGLVGLIFAVGLFFYELRERQDERIARAWQLVTTSAPGNSGKREALDFLNSQYGCWLRFVGIDWCWKEQVILRGIDVSVTEEEGHGAYLWEVDLENALLSGSNFFRAQLVEANLAGVSAYNANWKLGIYNRAAVTSANLRKVNFEEGRLYGTIFDGSCLLKTNFSQADFWNQEAKDKAIKSSFRNAGLYKADFTGADLRNADFTGATLNNVNFTGAKLKGAIFANTTVNSAWAHEFGVPKNIPDGLTIREILIAEHEPSDIPKPPQCAD